MEKILGQRVEMKTEEASYELTKRFLAVSIENFDVLAEFTGFHSRIRIAQALVELAKAVNAGTIVRAKKECLLNFLLER